MNPFDHLETELRAMRPREASTELKRRIVDQLDRPLPLAVYRPWGIALAGALAAACLAAIALWRTGPNGAGSLVGPPVSPAVETTDVAPTVLAYRNALVRSPEHFSALLDQHAAVTLPHNPARNGIRAFIRPDVEFR